MPKEKPFFPWMETEKEKKRAEKLEKGFTHASRMGFYNLPQWRHLREIQLSKKPYCQLLCEREGRIVPATIAEHKKPIPESVTSPKEFLSLSIPIKHLQSSCAKCNIIKANYDKAGKKILSADQIRENMQKFEE